jgi:hypothetical protein
MSTTCFCPPDSEHRCSTADQTHYRGRRLCCPYDEAAMAAWYKESLATYQAHSSKVLDGRKSAMRKRLWGTTDEIAQRAADTRRGYVVGVQYRPR